MNSSFENLASDIYPEEIRSDVIRFHLFNRESIKDHFQNFSWVIAHKMFDGKSIPCLTSSELSYQPESEYDRELITGNVSATIPTIWNRPSIHEILKDPPAFIDDHHKSLLALEPSLNSQSIDVFDQHGFAIAAINGTKERSSITLSIDAVLAEPEDEEYYDSFKQCIELWGYLHDYIAHAGEANGIPLRFIHGDPQHEIYVGGTRPNITTTEMDLAELLEEHTRFESDIPTPEIGYIDFQAIEVLAEKMDRKIVQDAIKHVIAAKRIFYRYSKVEKPISHDELVNELLRRQSPHHQ